ncbi:MAG: tyrosine-type recombinase/integrase [Bryobacteraceae bacterium]
MARPSKHDGSIYPRKDGKVLWMVYRDRGGKRIRESTFTEDWQEAQKKLRERLQSRDDRILDVVRKGEQLQFSDWADFFLENYSKPPIRAEKTHEANERGCLHLKQAFGKRAVGDITVDDIELYLRKRLQTRVQVRTAGGVIEKDRLKPATVHQELRILRRMMNVAVRKKLLPANPCAGVEFPVKVKGLFRPHYMAWSEQQRIEFQAPEYLRNIIRIISETGLRVYKELMPMKKEQVDLQNAVVWIPDSKTPNGIAEVPLTDLARDAFQDQIRIAGPGTWLFPSDANPTGHQKTLKTVWHAALRRAKVPYFRIYDLRSTYATRLSAGGVADEWVTQLLRQGDAKVFKKYSQMKLQMKREALQKLNRKANEDGPGFDTVRPN